MQPNLNIKKNKSKNKVDAHKGNRNEFIKNNTLILKSQQIFRSKRYDVFTGSKLTRFHWVLMIMKEYNQLIQ